MWLSDCRKHSDLDVLQNTMLHDWWCSRYLQSRTKWFPNLSSCFQNRDPDCRAHEKYRSASALSSHRRMLKYYYISDSVSKIFLPKNKLAFEIKILKFSKEVEAFLHSVYIQFLTEISVDSEQLNAI